jgi:hypothetical protein
VTIKIKTQKEYERLLKLDEERVSVTDGVHDEEGSQEHPNANQGETVAEIAQDHEFGFGVPQRSWLRAWVDSTDFKPLIKDLPLEERADTLARRLQDSIQGRIREGKIPPPNSPRTILAKGHDKTLIDTETFVNAVTAKVVKK